MQLSGVVAMFSDFSVEIAMTGGRLSLAHLTEFSHFVDLYLLEDNVYIDDASLNVGLARLTSSGLFVGYFAEDPTSPLKELPRGALTDAVYNVSDATLSIYTYAPRERSFCFGSYDYWRTDTAYQSVPSTLSECTSDRDRLLYHLLDENITAAIEELDLIRIGGQID